MATPNFTQEERRYKIYRISRTQLLQMITGEVRILNIPEWSTILEIMPDFQSRGFMIMIHHPSFPEIDESKIHHDIEPLDLEHYPKATRKLIFK